MNKHDSAAVVNRMNAFVQFALSPKPEQLRVRHVVTTNEIDFARHDFAKWCDMVKHHMARQLANHIVEKCGVLAVPDSYTTLTGGDMVIEMELTINDASAYDRWLPAERRRGVKEGFAEGRRAERAAAPWGFEPDQFYE